MTINDKIQSLCRYYLCKLRPIAEKHNLGRWIDRTINDNEGGKCMATEEEVAFLSRCVDDERLSRSDIPRVIGKSYRYCVENDLFDHIKKLRFVGIYSKVSALLFNENKDDGNRQDTL